ncbi:MAG: hypothetical protein ABWY06_07265 [Pseudomonas sp.]|uniref:hypothetical protein n=1 Tax=Pseudomonas sp. TaxID=306 RepID=UPI0033954335
MRVFTPLLLGLLCLASSGCTYYYYNNQRFKHPEPAYQAQARVLNYYRGSVAASPVRFAGRALLISPDRALLERSIPDLLDKSGAKAAEYLIRSTGNDLKAHAALLQAAGVFQAVSGQESADPLTAAQAAIANFDAVYYVQFDALQQRSWYLLTRNSAQPVKLLPEQHGPLTLPQLDQWVTSVASAYREHGGANPLPVAAPSVAPAAPLAPAARADNATVPATSPSISYDECILRVRRISDQQLRLQALPSCDEAPRR